MKHPLRLIKGSSKKLRLFVGYTKPSEWKKFTLNWYVKDRKSPVAPYEVLIEDYRHLADWQKIEARFSVDEHFTQNEAKELKTYLKDKYKVPLLIAEEEFPTRGILQHDEPFRRRFFSYRLNQDLDPEGSVFFSLADLADHDYSLSFSVGGEINVISILVDNVLSDQAVKGRGYTPKSDYCGKCGALKSAFHKPGCYVESGKIFSHQLIGPDTNQN